MCRLVLSAVLLCVALPTAARELVLLTWPEYIDPALVAEFERLHEVTLRQAFFDSDEERDELMIATGGSGFDLIMVNQTGFPSYRERGWLAPLTAAEVPNLRHIEPHWHADFPPAVGYGVPYFWGTVGIAYRRDLVAAAPRSWMDLLRPSADLHGRILMLRSEDEVVGVALKALGHSLNDTDPRVLARAIDLLLAQKPAVLAYTTPLLTERSDLVSGAVVMAMTYSGDALMLRDYEPAIEYVVPKEGSMVWVDYLSVSARARETALAYAFVNFLNEPRNAARLAEYVSYATPNRSAAHLMPADYRRNTVINPGAEALANSEMPVQLPARVLSERNTQFSRVVN